MERNLDVGKETRHLNCWEYMSCGREPGGRLSESSGICPASTEQGLDKVHGGKNAGRACWVVAGTFGKKRSDCTLAGEYRHCSACPFYKMVKNEEGIHFWPPKLLHRMLRTGTS
jgi:hypothetical protein